MEIRVNEVSKTISGKQILSKISFDIGNAECVGLVGPNGAGKTTLIRSMLGLYAVDGEILYDGVGVKDMDFLKSNVFFMLDNFGLFKQLNVHDNLEFFYRAYNGPRVDKKDMDVKIENILHDINLSERSDDMVKSLSKGMKQRLSLGRTMVSSPSILILDEPFSSLDFEGQLFLLEYIKKLKIEGTAVLISSHDLGHLQKICDSVVFIKKGELLKKMSSNEYDTIEATYIDLMIGNRNE